MSTNEKTKEELLEEIALLKKKFKDLEEEFAEHKKECALINKGTPAFVKEDVVHNARRKHGAPVGHTGYWRKIPERVDFIKPISILACPCCGGMLSAVQELRERYVEDLPQISAPVVTKYVIERKYCAQCRKIVEGEISDVLPGARLGLRVMLLIAVLKIRMALPENKIVELLKSAYAFSISAAEVVCALNQLRREFGAHYANIGEKIRDAPVKGCDETGWRLDGVNHWVWCMIAEEVVWYKVHRRRSYKVIQPVLQEQNGKILVTDRLTTYNHLAAENGCSQQTCWAHILRDSKRLAKNYDEAKTVHRRLKSIFHKAKKMAPHGTIQDVEKLLKRIDSFGALHFEHKSIRTFRNSISKKHRLNLFHFVTNAAVPSTNNGTERAIRKAVIIRKISNGNRSEKGARILETLLSIIETIRLQGKNPLEEMHRMLTSRA
ncbi:IS66 family transposase [archaeon]|nr:IS66 family transposase [archaeon]